MKCRVLSFWQTIAAVGVIGPIPVELNRTFADLNQGLVGYSTFGEGSGDITSDSSGYGNGGAIYDGPVPARLAARATAI